MVREIKIKGRNSDGDITAIKNLLISKKILTHNEIRQERKEIRRQRRENDKRIN